MAKPKPAKADDAASEEREVTQAEKDVVGKLLGEIERAKSIRKTFDETTLPKLRRYSWGTRSAAQGDISGADTGETTTRTNLIFATTATLLPHIYAKNPEIAVAPTEAVGEDEYEKIKDFCKTAQVMLNNLFIEEGKLKRRMKSNARSAMGTSVGWIKMSFQKSLAGDPLIVRRANDMQDNLRRIEYLVARAKKETDTARLNQERAELQQQLKTVMDSPEIKVFKGFALDRVKTEDIFILDESIVEFDDYVTAKKIAHRVWMSDDEYCETFGSKVGQGATTYSQPAAGDLSDESGSKVSLGEGASKVKYRAVFEVWDRTANTICCVCEGSAGYAKPPHILKPASERWYSFFALGFNIVEGRWRPLADVELLMKLQDEYTTTRYLFAETRKEAIPTRVFRKAGNLTEEDVTALAKRRSRDWIGIEGNPSVPLNQDILQLEGIKIDPAAFDVSIIRNDMDMLVGLSDASRANLIQAKTATEAEIMSQALMTRVAERQDTIEDLTSEMANAALQIMLQEFSSDEVKEIAGDGAVWPELDNERIFRKVRVSVRAGSTGKPNLLKERESWAQIMPIINDTITQVMELRGAGQFDLANSKIELLKETLTRYDEKIDVDRFIPKQEKDENGQPIAAQNAAAQGQQMQEQMKAMQEEFSKLQQENQQLEQQLGLAKQAEQAKIADIESKKTIALAQEQAKQTELDAKRKLDEDLGRYEIDTKAKTAIEVAEINKTATLQAAQISAAQAAVEGGQTLHPLLTDPLAFERPKVVQAMQDARTSHEKQMGEHFSAIANSLAQAAESISSASKADRVVEVSKHPDGVTRGTSRIVN